MEKRESNAVPERMTASYHTHTERCHHAFGTEREYVEAAIESGLKILGFADHTPQPYGKNVRSRMRMSEAETENYVDTVLALKKEYKDDIEIHLGVEAEYWPDLYEGMLRILEQYPIEYMLLGQHFTDSEFDMSGWTGTPRYEEATLAPYIDRVIDGMETGRYLYVAHPDIISFAGTDTAMYLRQLGRICEASVRLDIPLELNLQGLYENRSYPVEAFWEMAGRYGCKVVMGKDTHDRGNLLSHKEEERAFALVKRYGLTLLPDLHERIAKKPLFSR